MTRGFVYIFTNPCLDGWVKIGTTNNIGSRLKALNHPPNIPLSFRAYATYEVENPKEVEKHIHCLLDDINEKLHAREELESGRIRKREFFQMSPEKAYAVFKTVASIRKDSRKLKLIVPSPEDIEDEQIAEQVARRPNFTFSMLGIRVGSKLRLLYDEVCICVTKDKNNKVEYKGKVYTLSKLARKLLIEKHGWSEGTQVSGPRFFTYRGKTIFERFCNIQESQIVDEE